MRDTSASHCIEKARWVENAARQVCTALAPRIARRPECGRAEAGGAPAQRAACAAERTWLLSSAPFPTASAAVAAPGLCPPRGRAPLYSPARPLGAALQHRCPPATGLQRPRSCDDAQGLPRALPLGWRPSPSGAAWRRGRHGRGLHRRGWEPLRRRWAAEGLGSRQACVCRGAPGRAVLTRTCHLS